MAKGLHLLRNVPPRCNGRRVDPEAFVKLIKSWGCEPGSVGGTWTRRRPRRLEDLEGGSIYYVASGWTLFRTPFLGIEAVADFHPDAEPEWLDAWALLYEPRVIMVQSRRIHRLQGWRYLEPANAPPDI